MGRFRIPFVVGLISVLLAACSSTTTVDTTLTTLPTADADQVVATVANYDVAVGDDERILVGLLTGDHRDIGLGDVRMRFAFQSDGGPDASPEAPGPWQDGRFLLLPEEKPKDPGSKQASVVTGGEGRGVYATDKKFDRSGYYNVDVEVDVSGIGKRTSTAVLNVRDKHQFLAVGDDALKSKNLVASSTGVPAKAIDSRATPSGSIPDPQMHQTTIADAIARKKPALVSFATPVFCRSRFCGPTVDLMDQLQKKYGDRVEFIHVEIWKDFDKQQPNDVAADWLLRNDDLPEPWVYLIGSDGKVAARWDNLVTQPELEPELERVK